LHLICLLVAQPSHFKNASHVCLLLTVCTSTSASWQRQSCDSLSTHQESEKCKDLALGWSSSLQELYSLVSVYFYKTLHVSGERLHEQTCDVTPLPGVC